MRTGLNILIGGIVAIVVGSIVEVAIQQDAISAMRSGNPTAIMEKMQGLQLASALANLMFYGGGLAVVIGIVLLVVQSQQQQNSAPHSAETPSNAAELGRATSLEEENRRLKEELARSKLAGREQGDAGS